MEDSLTLRLAESVQKAADQLPNLMDSIEYLQDIGQNTSDIQNKVAKIKSDLRRNIEALKKRGVTINTHGISV